MKEWFHDLTIENENGKAARLEKNAAFFKKRGV
jgi:hypothetical protein